MKPQDELPFMSFAVAQWIADTVDLTPVQYAVLDKLRSHAWLRGQLPNDLATLARIVGVSSEELNQIFPVIQHWFEKSRDGKTMTMPKLEAERVRALDLRTKKRRAGALGNAARWGSDTSQCDADANRNAIAKASHSESHCDADANRPHILTHISPSISPNPEKEGECEGESAGSGLTSVQSSGLARPGSRVGRNSKKAAREPVPERPGAREQIDEQDTEIQRRRRLGEKLATGVKPS